MNIEEIFNKLTVCNNLISHSNIRNMLKGKLKVEMADVEINANVTSSPTLEEAESAFKKYNCAILTAFRGGYTIDENLARNEKLKEDMNALTMSFRPVNGCYREADWQFPCEEYCFFVFNGDTTQSRKFFEQVYQLSAKYNQDSFLYKPAGIYRAAFLVATSDAGRKDLHGDIKFAGQLYTNVTDVNAWTDCADGRFAFQLKGMVLIKTGEKKIKLGEGDVFDIKGYKADGLLVLYNSSQQDIDAACKSYNGTVPLVRHAFKNDSATLKHVHDVICDCLNQLRDQKCKRIGIHCSVSIVGSPIDGAAATYITIQRWAKRNDKHFNLIVIVDTYGDFCLVN